MAELNVGTLQMTIMADGTAAIQELDRVKEAATGAADGIESSFDGAAQGMEGVAGAAGEVAGAAGQAGEAGAAAGKKIDSGAKKATASLKEVGKMMNDVGKSATKFLTLPIVGALTAAVSGASDLTETVGKTEVVFDRMSGKVMKWSEDSVRAMGLAQGSALDYASTYGDMATGMGLSIEKSADMSMSLTQLAADMASFKNISTEVAAQKLNAVFTGETEGLKSMGIVMTQANLQAFALTQGITEQVSKLSQAEQVMLRYQYVMNATKNAQGDFVRTGDSLANQSRKLTETLKQAGESFGAVLTPAVTGVVSTLQGIVQHIAELDEGTKRIIVSAALAAATVGPVLLVGGKLLTLIVSLKGAIAALSLNPVIVALTAAAALGAAFVAYRGALSGANDEAIRATESYQRMKRTVEGGVDTEVNVDTTELDEIEDKDVTVNITAEGEAAIQKAEALVKEIGSDKYKGMLAIDGNPAKADAVLEKVKGDIRRAKDAILAIDANPEAARTAVDELKADIDLLEGLVVVTEDPVAKAALEARIAALKTEVATIAGSVSFTVPAADQAALDHYRETLNKLPKDQTFKGYGTFEYSEDGKESLKQFNDAMFQAAGKVGEFKDAVKQMQDAVDADLQAAILSVAQQANAQADVLTALHESGDLTDEQYIAGLQKILDEKDAEVQRLQQEAEDRKKSAEVFADGSAGNDAEGVAKLKTEEYRNRGTDVDITKAGNQAAQLIDQSEDRGSMQMEGLTALAGYAEQAQAQYEGLAAAVETYRQAQADAAAQQESADQLSQQAEAFGSVNDAVTAYSSMLMAHLSEQEAFNIALQSMGEDADPAAIQALSDVLHDADGNLRTLTNTGEAFDAAMQLQGETAQAASEAQQAASEQQAQALADLQGSLQELSDSGLTSGDAEQALIQIGETGVDISGAKAALITGVPAAVEEAITAANTAAETGENPMDALAAAVGASAGVVETATGTAVSTASSGAANTAKSASKQIGENLMTGSKAGVEARAGELARAAAKAVRDAIRAAKAAEESNSPSKVAMREIGAPLMQGAEVGIVRETPRVLTTVKRSVQGLISGAASVARTTAAAGWLPPAPAAAGPAIDYEAMGTAMSGAMSRVSFRFGVGSRDLAEATREDSAGQMAFRANQVNRGYGGR